MRFLTLEMGVTVTPLGSMAATLAAILAAGTGVVAVLERGVMVSPLLIMTLVEGFTTGLAPKQQHVGTV